MTGGGGGGGWGIGINTKRIQSSVIGPIFLLPIYVNDLSDEISSQVNLFADYTISYLTIADKDDGTVLQRDLDRLSVWECMWDMELNPSKCRKCR